VTLGHGSPVSVPRLRHEILLDARGDRPVRDRAVGYARRLKDMDTHENPITVLPPPRPRALASDDERRLRILEDEVLATSVASL
jgi:hypothetical protein